MTTNQEIYICGQNLRLKFRVKCTSDFQMENGIRGKLEEIQERMMKGGLSQATHKEE